MGIWIKSVVGRPPGGLVYWCFRVWVLCWLLVAGYSWGLPVLNMFLGPWGLALVPFRL